MSELQREALKKRYGGLPPAPSAPGKHSGGGRLRRKRDYSPLPWDQYFESSQDVSLREKTKFRVYQSGNTGPLLLLLHGGGHSALSWAVFTKSITTLCHCQVLAVDLRGHGNTSTEDDADLSTETLSKDVGDIIAVLYMGSPPPPILLVGHSMGGSIAVHVAYENLLPSLVGLAVLDVVEGSAMEALSAMQSFLRSRPSKFRSLEEAIEWSVRSGQIHNLESARVSMVGQLVRCNNKSDDQVALSSPVHSTDVIREEPEDEETATIEQHTDSQDANDSFTWRIDLSKTDRFWEGWFKNMSKLFLSCPVPKLLLLAGIDRLDKDLSVGQMQGKFQLQILPRCGHCLHEDAPDRVAEVLVTFLVRLKLAQPKETFQRSMPAC